MKLKVIFPAAALLAAIAASFFAWHDHAATTDLELQATALATAGGRLTADATTLHHRIATALKNRDAAKAAIAAIPPPPSSPPTVAPKPSPPRPSNDISVLIRNEPDAQASYMEMQRSRLAAQYGPLFRQLNLSPEAAAKFADNVIKLRSAQMDIANTLAAQGPETEAAGRKLYDTANRDFASAQQALLGDTGNQQWQDYEKVSGYRSTVSALAGVAAVEHVPYTPAQADALVAAIYASRGPGSSGIDWEAVDNRARTILTPTQFEVYRTMDPGPSIGGALQARLYTSINRATVNESAATSSTKPGH